MTEFLQEQNQKETELKKKRGKNRQIETGNASIQCSSGVVSRPTMDGSVQTKKKRGNNRHVETGNASIQCGSGVVSWPTMDASVQTDHYDVTSELRQQIQNLTEVVKQLSALKCIHQHEPKTPASPLFDHQLSDTLLDPALSAVIRSFCNSTPVDPSQQAATAVPVQSQPPLQPLLGQNHGEELLPVYPPQVLPPRQPLLAVDQNIISPSSTHSHGPTDEQRKKVAAIVEPRERYVHCSPRLCRRSIQQ